MPTPLKSPGQRLRRNLAPGAIRLPLEGYQGPIPRWPLNGGLMSDATAGIWHDLWRKPQAAAWAPMGIERTVARYVLDCVLLESQTKTTMAVAHLHSEARQLEDRLGLNPLALMRLHWEIVDDEVAEQREEPRRRRLKVADPDAGA